MIVFNKISSIHHASSMNPAIHKYIHACINWLLQYLGSLKEWGRGLDPIISTRALHTIPALNQSEEAWEHM